MLKLFKWKNPKAPKLQVGQQNRTFKSRTSSDESDEKHQAGFSQTGEAKNSATNCQLHRDLFT